MRFALTIPVLLLLSSCTYKVVFPSSHLSILYPDGDTAYMPLRFQMMVASFSGGFGFYHEGFGGDVKSEAKVYGENHPPFAVYIDGRRELVSDSPIVHLSLEEGVHTIGVSFHNSNRIASSMTIEAVSDYPYRLIPFRNASMGWVDSTIYRDSLIISGSYVICDSSALYVPPSGEGLILIGRDGNVERVNYPQGFTGLACVDGNARPVSIEGDSLRSGSLSLPLVDDFRDGYVSMFASGNLVLASSGRGLWILQGGRWLRGYAPLRHADIECNPVGAGFVVVGIIPIPVATFRTSCYSPNPAVDIYGNYLHVDGVRYRIERRER